MSIMVFIIIVLTLIVGIGLLNEKVFRLQGDIALLMFSVVISGVLAVICRFAGDNEFTAVVHGIGNFGFEKYLMDCVLCFMLFAGASKVNMGKFRHNLKPISLLALLTTVVSAVVYGLLFRLISMIFGLGMDIWTCILLGCIVSPTDPIAATGILNKLGLSKNVISIIESESLFNDGTGVALFVFVKSIVTGGKSNFFVIMLKEVVGAFAVAMAVSFVLFRLLKLTKDPIKHILISILDVALVYAVCEHFGFSGVIASVVCGMYFAYSMDKISRQRAVQDPHGMYNIFWDVADNILNAVLFAMIGITVLNVGVSNHIPVIIPAAIIIVIISRFAGVWVSTEATGKKRLPASYNTMEFSVLMTWSALKGGLSLALAMSTQEFLPGPVYEIILNAAYITIFFTVVVQGLSISKAYKGIEKHKAQRIRKQSEAIS